MPLLVPTELLASGLALRSVASQIANVSGPALGGLLFALSPKIVYGAGTGLFAVSLLSAATMNRSLIPVQRAGDPAPGFRSLLLGIRFIRHTKIILGAISLDLFAVLFGGSVSLLPLFARSILHTGPVGLGVLRSATAVGALIAGIQLTRKPMGGRAGRKLLVIVGVFGGCMIVFGLSHSFTLSFVALAVSGYVDMFSMNIRSTVVTLAAPNALLGRVSAVENVFISASNELGAFESGLAAVAPRRRPGGGDRRRHHHRPRPRLGPPLPTARQGQPPGGRPPSRSRNPSRSSNVVTQVRDTRAGHVHRHTRATNCPHLPVQTSRGAQEQNLRTTQKRF